MPRVLIAIGSNCLQCVHVQWASQRLSALLADVRLSRTLWTADIRGTGRQYVNRLVSGHTTLAADELVRTLKAIEAETGRSHGRVTVDLDLMEYDAVRHHLSDWPRPYIQQLIPDLQ